MMKRLLFLVLISIMPVVGFGQFKNPINTADISTALKYPLGLGKQAVGILGLDPSRLNISQSYQMNVMSLGGHSLTQGLYLNTMTYQFSIPMTVSLQWGIAHQPLANTGASSVLNSGPFISNASVRYQPSEKTTIQLEFSRYPYGMNPWYRRGQW